MQLHIRPITQSDVEAVEQLAYDYNYELDPIETTREAVGRWVTSTASESEKGNHFFWLACVKGNIAGFVSFELCTNPFTQEIYGFIEDMYVVPSYRRHGYAEQLARAAFAELTKHGATKIQLDVLVNNQQALAFWQKLGFTLHHYVLTSSTRNATKEVFAHPL